MRWTQGVLVSCIVCAIITMGTTFVFAIDHKVTVTNKTDYSCGVFVYYGNVLGGVENKWMHLDPNQTNHIGTGAKCPRWIMGGCSGGYNFARCTLGPESNNLESCTLTCWSSDWFIKKNADGSVRLDKE